MVDELQKMPEGVAIKEKVPRGTPKKDKGGVRNRRPKRKEASESDESELSELEDVEEEIKVKAEPTSTRSGRKSIPVVKEQDTPTKRVSRHSLNDMSAEHSSSGTPKCDPTLHAVYPFHCSISPPTQ